MFYLPNNSGRTSMRSHLRFMFLRSESHLPFIVSLVSYTEIKDVTRTRYKVKVYPGLPDAERG